MSIVLELSVQFVCSGKGLLFLVFPFVPYKCFVLISFHNHQQNHSKNVLPVNLPFFYIFCLVLSLAHHSQGMAPGRYCYRKLLRTVAPVETLQSTMIVVNSHQKEETLGMMVVQAVAAEAPARGVTCLPTGQRPVEIGQTIVDHSQQSTPQDNRTSLLDMYQAW